jgi:hypothetical protein
MNFFVPLLHPIIISTSVFLILIIEREFIDVGCPLVFIFSMKINYRDYTEMTTTC